MNISVVVTIFKNVGLSIIGIGRFIISLFDLDLRGKRYKDWLPVIFWKKRGPRFGNAPGLPMILIGIAIILGYRQEGIDVYRDKTIIQAVLFLLSIAIIIRVFLRRKP